MFSNVEYLWLYITSIADVILAGIAVFMVLRDGSKPIRMWSWILLIIFLPFLGSFAYFSLGMNLRKQKMFDLKRKIDYEKFETFIEKSSLAAEEEVYARNDVTTKYIHLIRLLTEVNSSLISFNNKVTILHNGQQTYESIFEACEQAEEYIHLQYYIFMKGDLADRFIEIFKEKISQGVTVRLIYDAVGSFEPNQSHFREMREIGVQLVPFMPVRFRRLARLNYRNHRKILIVDGKVGFTGGINVHDKYVKGGDTLGYWTDTHLRIEGIAVNFLHFVFLSDWLFVSDENLIEPSIFRRFDTIGDTPVQIVSSGPDTDYPNILQQYLYILYQAKDYVYIVNPYIVPDSALSLAIKTVALSGIDVRLILAERSDSVIMDWTVRSYFGRFLNSGVRIYLYQKGFIHSKVIISDDHICSIGTANLDYRSFEQNFEVNALIYEREATLQMKEEINQFQEDSYLLTLEEHDKRGQIKRIKEKIGRLSSPLM